MYIQASDLLLTLGIAALIGAAGGWVYARHSGLEQERPRPAGRIAPPDEKSFSTALSAGTP